jgi:hypothetical protein
VHVNSWLPAPTCNNHASRYGGGLYLANGLLKNCLIAGNASLGNTAPLATAGGMTSRERVLAVMAHCQADEETDRVRTWPALPYASITPSAVISVAPQQRAVATMRRSAGSPQRFASG